MKKIFLFAAAFFVTHAIFVHAQPNKVAKEKLIASIEYYAESVKDFVENEGGPHIIIADVSDYNNSEQPDWKVYSSEAEFESARETEESYTIAYIWKKDGYVAAVNFTYSSPSGDWAQYMYYAFREDGSVARINRNLRTFMDDLIVNRTYIYDENGKVLKETTEFRDLRTDKPVKARKDFIDLDVDFYKSTSELPFAELLSGEMGSNEFDSFVPVGWKLEDVKKGDLNGDSIADAVLQLRQVKDEGDDFDRRIVILLKGTSGSFSKAAQSDNVIRCSICGGMLGGGPADIEIEKGILLISQMYGSRQGTNYLHRLRYEPSSGRFRLIGEDVANFDRLTGETESTSTNFLTGKQITTKTRYNEKTDKDVVVSKQEKISAKGKKYLEDINYEDY